MSSTDPNTTQEGADPQAPATPLGWMDIARDFVESEGYEPLEEGPLPDSFVVEERETDRLRGGSARWLVQAREGMQPDQLPTAEALRDALANAGTSGLIAVHQYADDAAYTGVLQKLRETMEKVGARYRWRLVSATEIEANPEMSTELRQLYRERFAGEQTPQRALQRVTRFSFVLGLLMLWVVAALVAKRTEAGESVLAALFVSYGWILLIMFLLGFVGTLFYAPLYMAAQRFGPYVVALVLLPLVVWMWAGSYNPARDLLAVLLALLLVAYALRPLFERLEAWLIEAGMTRAAAVIWRRRAKAATWLLGVWVLASLGDRWLGTGWTPPTPLTADPASFAERFPKASDKSPRLGLALSGGGYRAALLHAGVLAALEERQVPVAGLSTVSGGSIIGGAYVHGVKPAVFKERVKEGGFNLKREIFNISNLALLPCPLRLPGLDLKLLWFCSHSRTDAQSALLDRLIFADARMAGAPSTLKQSPDWWQSPPWWLVGGTDLMTGDLIGIGAGGLFRRSHPTPGNSLGEGRLQRVTSDPRFDELAQETPLRTERVSRIVAASGAFPGALASLNWNLSSDGRPCGSDGAVCIQVADGGLTDNLGFSLLMTAHQWGVERELEQWRLDMILVSDGGMPLQQEEDVTVYTDMFRAMDVVYASSGLEVSETGGASLPNLWLSPQTVSLSRFPGDLPASFIRTLKEVRGIESLDDAQQDLRRCQATFFATSTLQDQFKIPLTTRMSKPFQWVMGWLGDDQEGQGESLPYEGPEAVEAIYTLGQYLVHLNWAQLEAGWSEQPPEPASR